MTSMWPLFFEQQRVNVQANIATSWVRVDRQQWSDTAQATYEAQAVFLSLWGADDHDKSDCFRIYAAYLLEDSLLVVEHPIRKLEAPTYPSIAAWFPAALRMQRAVYDLLGIAADELDVDRRGWLRHGGWPEQFFPLRRNVDGAQQFPVISEPYPFVTVEGDGVHEIGVGPVHAGTIEPGNFRFSVVGEKVLRLEERLGYTHKGIAKRFERLLLREGHRLAARVSGDSAVAFSWAYCVALEAIAHAVCSARATDLRALALEHERIANHLGDLGALGNDAGFAFGNTQFSRFKEDLLRTNRVVFGVRYLLDYLVPGGVAQDLPAHPHLLLMKQYLAIEQGVSGMRSIYDEHAGLQDRFREAGRLDKSLAAKLGAVGLAGRASGISRDLRVDHAWPPYDRLAPKLMLQAAGDVAARVQVRFDEIFESLRMCRTLVEQLSVGPIRVPVPLAEPELLGIGLIEGWRGPVMVVLESGPDETVRRCHTHDPSWQNWPLVEYAILGNIVPDFPLINKSFNLSYSGQDG